jgi:hypothetical protein
MDIRIAEIIVANDGRAFIPSNARYKNGLRTNIEPVYIAQPNMIELLPIVRKILQTPPTILPDPTQEEVKIRRDLLPRIIGTRNWKSLSQTSMAFLIESSDKGYLLQITRLDSKGRWEFDPSRQRSFQPSTDLRIVVQAILDNLSIQPK